VQIALREWNFHAVLTELSHDRAVDVRVHFGMAARVSEPNPKTHVPGFDSVADDLFRAKSEGQGLRIDLTAHLV